MPHADFVHLRVHTAYSLSAGAIKVKDLVKLAKKAAMPAVAMTDTGNLFGALELAMAATDSGVQPVVGCELPIRRVGGQESRPGRPMLPPKPERIVLLAQSEAGYRNLLKLVSEAYLATEGTEEPQIALDRLGGRTDGLLALTGGPEGPIGRALAEGQGPLAEATLATMKSLFPGRLYVELQRHGLAGEDRVEPDLVDLAYRHDLPLVATNDCYFANAGMYEAHDALLCIAEGRRWPSRDRRRVTPEHWFKTAAEMRALFADLPEACDNTLAIARRCAVMTETAQADPAGLSRGRRAADEAETVRAMAAEGLERGSTPWAARSRGDARTATYRDRLAYELDVIVTMGFAGYFLIVADFIQWAKAQGIPVGPGRGSGAGSRRRLGAHHHRSRPAALRSAVRALPQPRARLDAGLRHRLLPGPARRGDRLRPREYGHDKVAQIITFGKLQAEPCCATSAASSSMPLRAGRPDLPS